jgi:hypothetical protein
MGDIKLTNYVDDDLDDIKTCWFDGYPKNEQTAAKYGRYTRRPTRNFNANTIL